jgi:N-methylhydantoinase A/oxoprolinase/acetone carboxylase beta subunit
VLSIGIDIGGTFTDVVAVDDSGKIFATKVASTPSDLVRGVRTGLDSILEATGAEPGAVRRFMHGTTVATNALLEERGATVGLITTAGFEDVLEIGRQVRPREALYGLDPGPQTPVFLAPRRRRLGVSERVDSTGVILTPLDEEGTREAARRLVEDEQVGAIAICFLFSFLNPAHELRARELVHDAYPDVDISLSSEVDPVFREYERLCMTCTDAYIRPVVSGYIERLGTALGGAGIPARLQVMQSRGAITGADNALRRPVSLVASGPAAGVQGALGVAADAQLDDAITIDIGGTSSDIALVRGGRALMSRGGIVRGFPLRMPMIEVASIGAGGGSIAWIDSGGGLRVGPRSAGAEPGPACYGRGGTAATVTDASLVLGYLSASNFAGGRLALNEQAAEAAVGRVGEELGLDTVQTALGIQRIVNAHMSGQIHLMSVNRGHDVRRFGLVVLGGAGPVHGCDVAEELSIQRVVVPYRPGVLAAHGLLESAIEHEQTVTFARRAVETEPDEVESRLAQLEDDVLALMRHEDVGLAEVDLQRAADMRYVGQSYELEVSLPAPVDAAGLLDAAVRFRELHQRTYGHASADAPLEFVNLRATARHNLPQPPPVSLPANGPAEPKDERTVHFAAAPEGVTTGVYDRWALGAGATVAGPAIVEQADSTVVLPPAWTATVRTSAELVLERSPA